METQLREDLVTLGLDDSTLNTVSMKEVIHAWRKKSKVVHPDKAGKEKEEQERATAEFQALSNAYQRLLKFLVDKQKNETKNNDIEDPEVQDDDVKFTRDNFDMFNFPMKNTDSFTVVVENHLADIWQ